MPRESFQGHQTTMRAASIERQFRLFFIDRTCRTEVMLKFSLHNLLSRPLRSLLALLGLTVAIVGMVGLFSVAEGLDEMVGSTFGRVPGLVALQPGAPIPLFSRIPSAWESDLKRIPGVREVNAEIWQRVNLIEGKMIVSPPRLLFGTDIKSRLRLRQGVYKEDLVAGRFLIPEDRGTYHAVLSRQIAEEFGKGVGDTLRVNGQDLDIVGIYHCGSLLLDMVIILDIDQVRSMTRFGDDAVSGFYIEQTGEVADDELVRRIQVAFQGRELNPWKPTSAEAPEGILGGLARDIVLFFGRESGSPGNTLSQSHSKTAVKSSSSDPHEGAAAKQHSSGAHGTSSPANERTETSRLSASLDRLPIEVRSSADWAEHFKDFSADLDIFLLIMSGIGVTIAVMSIVNTMLMSVSERIIEFGILKANGWSRFDVLRLITSESALLGFGGGVLGSCIGWGATQVLNSIWPTRIHLVASPGLLLFATAFSTILGVSGGLYPAIWAMRMSPMDAIRK